MKHSWRKDEKEIYLPKQEADRILLPKMQYLVLSGSGDPNNNPVFQRQIEILYTLSYTLRMMPKNGFVPDGYFEYTVYPLEGVWSSKSDYRQSQNKADLLYDIMIRQPNFVSQNLVDTAIQMACAKKKLTPAEGDAVRLVDYPAGDFVQILHVGTFESESTSFAKMDDFIKKKNLERTSPAHREIYLSDFNKIAPDKLKTVLRVETVALSFS